MLNRTIQWITVSGPLYDYLWLEFERAVVWTAAFWLVTGIVGGLACIVRNWVRV